MSQFCNYYFAEASTPPGFLLVISDAPGFCNPRQRLLTGYRADPRMETCCGEQPVVRVGGCFEWCAVADRYKQATADAETAFKECLWQNVTTVQKGSVQVVPCFMSHLKSGSSRVGGRGGGTLLLALAATVTATILAGLVAVH